MLEDELDLVKKTKDGEVEAFGLLYDHYLPKIYRFVLVKVGRREEAEDLTHQAFLKAWQNISKYEYKGYSFGSWLYRIARNTVYDYYRQAKSELGIEDADNLGLLIVESDIEHETEKRIALGRIVKHLKKLKGVEEDVLIMRFVNDMPIKEVAATLGKSEGAIKLIQNRAIKSLKGLISQEA
ncbi:MAG: sigma-70 family RNA polymerase sigma factor [Patescibacteria group bacterium]|nr:sigma-70 family RNA polymerase sigma factor [Patescibacteria group bacterium]MDE2144723.1 sigma-70 family RNA polymerase sigma factor [Patescibacteria group bacterium]